MGDVYGFVSDCYVVCHADSSEGKMATVCLKFVLWDPQWVRLLVKLYCISNQTAIVEIVLNQKL